MFKPNGEQEKDKAGNPIPRPKRTFPPCHYSPKGCPKGTPETSKELSEKNMRAYRHYLECKAVGDFPQDAIVRRNAGIIRVVEDSVREERALMMSIGR